MQPRQGTVTHNGGVLLPRSRRNWLGNTVIHHIHHGTVGHSDGLGSGDALVDVQRLFRAGLCLNPRLTDMSVQFKRRRQPTVAGTEPETEIGELGWRCCGLVNEIHGVECPRDRPGGAHGKNRRLKRTHPRARSRDETDQGHAKNA